MKPFLGLDPQSGKLKLTMKNPNHIANQAKSGVKRHPETGKLILEPNTESIKRRSAAQQLAARKTYVNPKVNKTTVKVGPQTFTGKAGIDEYRHSLTDMDDIGNIPQDIFRTLIKEVNDPTHQKMLKNLHFLSKTTNDKLKSLLKEGGLNKIQQAERKLEAMQYGLKQVLEQMSKSKQQVGNTKFLALERIRLFKKYIEDLKAGIPTADPTFINPQSRKVPSGVDYYNKGKSNLIKEATLRRTDKSILNWRDRSHKAEPFMTGTTGKPRGRPKGSTKK